MDTPLVVAVHKENVHIGGGKATVTMKPDKLKTAKTAGKERKALADLSATQKHPVTRLSKGANLNSKSGLLGNFGKGSTPSDHALTDAEIKQCYEWAKDGIEEMGGYSLSTKDEAKLDMNQTLSDHALTDEEIKQCYEWAKEGIEEMGGYSWSTKDEAKLVMNQTLSEIMASAIGVSISELERPSSDEEGYETDESVFNNSISFSERRSAVYALEELDDPLGVAGIVLEEYPLPELKLDDDDYEEFNINNDGGIEGTQPFGVIRAAK